MSIKKEDVKFNKERKTFSKQIKRKVLLEYAKGKNVNDIVKEYLFEDSDKIKDEKYASKLIHKWKKEMYNNKEYLNAQICEPTKEFLDYEFKSLKITNVENEEINKETSALLRVFESLKENKK